MHPLTLDDLLPLDEYADRRQEFFEAHRRYLDRYRRVRVGPRLTLLFANRQTLWFHVHELLRVARLANPVRVQQELDLYNRLLPGRGELQAALVIDVPAGARLTAELAFWTGLHGDELCLRVGEQAFPAELVTCRPEDRAVGVAQWVQLAVDDAGRRLLADFRQPALFEIAYTSYRHQSAPLSADVRQSLLEDLEMSDRD